MQNFNFESWTPFLMGAPRIGESRDFIGIPAAGERSRFSYPRLSAFIHGFFLPGEYGMSLALTLPSPPGEGTGL